MAISAIAPLSAAGGHDSIVTTNGTSALADGTRVITARQTPSGQSESANSPALALTVDTAPPAPATAPDLQSASDLGYSTTDNLTADNTPTKTPDSAPFHHPEA